MVSKLICAVLRYSHKKVGVSLILLVQIVIAMLFLNYAYGKIQNILLLETIVKGSDLGDTFYLYRDSRYLNDNYELLQQRVNSLGYFDDYGAIESTNGIITENNLNAYMYFYNDKLIESVELPLSQGQWFSNADKTPDYVPAVISPDLLQRPCVGDFFYFKFRNITIKLKIIGILEKHNYYMIFNAGGTVTQLRDIFENNSDVIISTISDSFANKGVDFFENPGMLLFPKKDSDILDDEQWKNELKQYGYLNSMQDMVNNYRHEIREQLKVQGALAIVVLLFAISGIGGSNILSIINREKEYAVYFMHGATKKWCIIFITFQNVLLLLLGTVISFPLLYMMKESRIGYDIIVTGYNYILSFLIVASIFVVTSLYPIIVTLKASPVSIIRRSE